MIRSETQNIWFCVTNETRKSQHNSKWKARHLHNRNAEIHSTFTGDSQACDLSQVFIAISSHQYSSAYIHVTTALVTRVGRACPIGICMSLSVYANSTSTSASPRSHSAYALGHATVHVPFPYPAFYAHQRVWDRVGITH